MLCIITCLAKIGAMLIRLNFCLLCRVKGSLGSSINWFWNCIIDFRRVRGWVGVWGVSGRVPPLFLLTGHGGRAIGAIGNGTNRCRVGKEAGLVEPQQCRGGRRVVVWVSQLLMSCQMQSARVQSHWPFGRPSDREGCSTTCPLLMWCPCRSCWMVSGGWGDSQSWFWEKLPGQAPPPFLF